MKTISEKTQRVLLDAIEKTAELVNDGEHPDAAIAKAASACNVPSGNVHLIVHAYNTGRTNKQRQIGQTTLEKAAEFALASTDKVLELLYPTAEKMASDKKLSDNRVDAAYGYSPRGLLARRQLITTKAASTAIPLVEKKAEPYARDPLTAETRALGTADRLHRETLVLRREKLAAWDAYVHQFAQLGDYFRRINCLPLAAVQAKAAVLHGPKIHTLFEQLHIAEPNLQKLACCTRPLTQRIDATHEPFPLIEQVLQAAEKYAAAAASFAKEGTAKYQQAEVLLLPFAQPSAAILSVLDPSYAEKQALGMNTVGKVSILKNLYDSTAKGLQGPDEKSMLRGQYEQLTDPHHESELRNIRTQAVLHDLISNDDVISGYDPQETLHAFNDISQVAPRVVDQRMVLQSLLRKRLAQGAFDPFENDQVLGLESKMKQRDTLEAPPGGMPNANPA